MRIEDRELEGPELEREQRLEVEEVPRVEDELPVLAGEQIEDAELLHRGRLFDALRLILAHDQVNISLLHLPRRESEALEALQAAATGRHATMGTFVYAEDRASLLEQALAVLQQNLTHGDPAQLAELQARYDEMSGQVAELRDQLLNLEDAQEDMIEPKLVAAKAEGEDADADADADADKTDGANAKDAPGTTDATAAGDTKSARDKKSEGGGLTGWISAGLDALRGRKRGPAADAGDPAAGGSTLSGPDLPEQPRPSSTLSGPELRADPPKPSSLSGPELRPESAKPSTLSGPERPESPKPSTLSGPERPESPKPPSSLGDPALPGGGDR